MLYVFPPQLEDPAGAYTPVRSFVSCLQDEVFGSAYAAAAYLSSVLNFPMDKRVYVIGMSGLEDELRSEGISFIGGTVSRHPIRHLSTRISFTVAGSCR
jgi:ribonucleotide monophosphatase NagD (HAD superfamily)